MSCCWVLLTFNTPWGHWRRLSFNKYRCTPFRVLGSRWFCRQW